MGLENLTLRDRILHLMETRNIKNAADLSRAMIAAGIIQQNEDDPDQTVRNANRDINRHLSKNKPFTPDRLTGLWISRYCRFFRCSFDYLMGVIDSPSHSVQTVTEITGLSEAAVKTLISCKKAPNLAEPEALSAFLELSDFHQLMDLIIARLCLDETEDPNSVYIAAGLSLPLDPITITNYKITSIIPDLMRDLSAVFQQKRPDYNSSFRNTTDFMRDIVNQRKNVTFKLIQTKKADQP